ncbi:hypothetical protein BH10ACI4_BH10ACI4_03390 [soil metagenome]
MAHTKAITNRLLPALLFLSPTFCLAQAANQAQPQTPTPVQTALKPCDAKQLSLSVDSEGGEFNGMSHGGFLLVLRNIGPAPCLIPAYPNLTFSDTEHHPLDIVRENTAVAPSAHPDPGTRPDAAVHPAPVVAMVPVAPGAELTSTMRWVSSDVFDHGVCVNPTVLTMTLNKTELVAPITATLCGKSKASYNMTKLAPDPVYTPPAK